MGSVRAPILWFGFSFSVGPLNHFFELGINAEGWVKNKLPDFASVDLSNFLQLTRFKVCL